MAGTQKLMNFLFLQILLISPFANGKPNFIIMLMDDVSMVHYFSYFSWKVRLSYWFSQQLCIFACSCAAVSGVLGSGMGIQVHYILAK